MMHARYTIVVFNVEVETRWAKNNRPTRRGLNLKKRSTYNEQTAIIGDKFVQF